jgi:APA family basic amino acid/polyamine antiporter
VQWNAQATAVAATVAIVALTIVNHVGLRSGARTQSALTLVAITAIVGLGGWTIGTAPPVTAETASRTVGLAGLGAALVALLWTYDGWYGATFSAGEVRDPGRNLPRGIVVGTLAVVAIYAIAMTAYVRALPIAALQASPRVAEAAAQALAGPAAARGVAAVIVVCTLGCLAATILYCARAYVAMGEDGTFFASMARIHPRFHTPHVALWAQAAWAIALAWSGTYTQLYTFVTVAVVLFHIATALAVPVLRRRQPDLPRPYRVWGYPVLPIAFAAACSLLVVAALRTAPVESAAGLACIALGVPAARAWQRARGRRTTRGS